MDERRRIDSDFLDSVRPPEIGERWIADTLVCGFGLRLWAGKKGGGVAFCVRVSDLNGKSVRKTYDPFDTNVGYRHWFERTNDFRWENPDFDWGHGS